METQTITKPVKSDAQKGYVTTKKERFSYAMYLAGQNLFYVIGAVLLTSYCTDIGIATAALAGILLVVKIWDAVNDTLFGALVDKIRLKGGKFLPWLKISLFFIPIATMLMFMIPHGFPIWGQIVWITISYILWDTSYTLCDIPIYGLPTVMTGNQDERALILSNGRLSSSLCYNFAIAAIPLINGILRDALGFEFSYEIVISLFCAISLLLMIPIVKHAKERTVVKVEKPISFKEMGKYLFKNKYLLLYFLSYIVMGVLGVSATFALHLGRYLTPYMDNYQMYSGIVALVPFVIIAFFLPKLIKKYDKFKLYFWSLIIGVFLQIISFFVGYTNVWVFWVMYVLRTLPSIFTGILAFMFTGDLAEYGLYKTGNDASGCAFAVQTFSAKLTGSLAGSIALLILTGINFVEGSPVDGIPVIQPDGFNNALWAANIFVPVLGMALAVIPLLFYHLRDYKVQIMAAANRDLITREESDELLKLSRSAYLKIHEARILKLISESNQQTNPANTEVAHDTQTE